ncbi:MAG: sensor histidine kinase [Acidimicrobiales bacterium]
MDWSRRWRADLARPEMATSRRELPFLAVGAVVIVGIAEGTDPGSVLELGLLLPAVVAFVLRGLGARLPAEVFAATVLVCVTAAVGSEGNLEASLFLSVNMVLYVSWQLGSLLRAAVILAVATASPLLIAEVFAPESGISWTSWAMACAFVFLLGRVLHRQQLLIDQLEQARGALAAQAVAEERRRMARELHDLAGHTLAAMLLHVTGARHVLRRDVADAERALMDAEAVGRTSLDQVRATVAGLRSHERGTDRAVAGMADIGTLVEEYRRAGLAINASMAASVPGLDNAVGTALHRIAREALANVARHAPDNRVDFAIAADPDEVHLSVVDHGRAGTPPDPNAGHFGLVGMGERARALGGHFEAGPTPNGWRVDAHLPVQGAPRELSTS